MQPLLRGRREMSSLFVGESFCWGGGNFNPVAERATGLNGFEGEGLLFGVADGVVHQEELAFF